MPTAPAVAVRLKVMVARGNIPIALALLRVMGPVDVLVGSITRDLGPFLVFSDAVLELWVAARRSELGMTIGGAALIAVGFSAASWWAFVAALIALSVPILTEWFRSEWRGRSVSAVLDATWAA